MAVRIAATRLLGMIGLIFIASACSGDPSAGSTEERVMTLHGQPPIVIAHRGASGERPEHTLAAYALAIEQGADFIEPDLVLTKDGVLVARHENEIGGTTNVADKPEFADRKTTKTIDGREYRGWFTEDFTLAELKTLRARERLPELREANSRYDGQYDIPTLEEILQLLQAHEQETGTRIGIYPETKHPSYFAGLSLPHAQPMLAMLRRYGYADANDPVFIQSFEVGNLKQLANQTTIRLVQLVASEGGPPDDPAISYAEMTTAEGLTAIAVYADGLGPSKDMVIGRDALRQLAAPTGLVAAAHAAGLEVHPWTFRRENYFLPTDMVSGLKPSDAGDIEAEIRAYLAAGVDGLFSDNPREAVAAVAQPAAE